MAGPVRIAILANGSQAKREIGSVSRSLGGLGRGGIATAAVAALGGAIVGLGVSAVKAERAYSTSMRLIQAATGATQSDMDRLNDAAIRLGAETSFSAGEAADAMLALGRAGQSTEQILRTVPEVMNLAATEGIELGRAADIVTSGLAQFGLGAGQAERVVNALAGASNASRSSVEGLGESLKLVGAAGSGIGLSVEETAGALAALSQAGLDGSVAGTSLAAVFNKLVPQTSKASDAMNRLNLDFTDAKGRFDDIDTIAGKLQRTFGDMDAETRKLELSKIFGNDASTLAAVNALISEGADGLRDYTRAAEDNNAAQRLAEARMGGTEGAIEKLNGAIETAKLRLGQELAPAVEAGADALGDKLVPAMEAGIDAAKDIGRALAPAAEEIAEALSHLAGEGDAVGSMFNDVFLPALETGAEVVGGLVNFIDELPGPLKEVAFQGAIAAAVFPRLAGGVATATGAVSLQIAKLQQLRAEMTYTQTRAQLMTGAMGRMGAAAKTAAGIGGMVALTQGMQQTDDTSRTLLTTLGGVATGFSVGGPWGAAVGGAVGLLGSLSGAFGTTEEEAMLAKHAMDKAAEVEAQKAAYQSLKSTLDEVTGAYTRQTKAAIYDELVKAKVPVLAARSGVSMRDLVSALYAGGDAWDRYNENVLAHVPQNTTLRAALSKLNLILEDGTRATRNRADALIPLNQRLGITRKEAERIPKDVRMILRHNLPDGMRQLKNLNREVGGLDRRTIKLLLRNLGFDATEKRIKAVQQSLKNVSRTKGEAKLDADDKPARNKVYALERYFKSALRPPKIPLDADDGKARNKANDLNRIFLGLGPYKPTVDVPVPYDDAGRINQVFGSLGPYYATVNVTYRTTNSPPGGGEKESAFLTGAGRTMATTLAAGIGTSEAWEKAGKDALDRILKGFLRTGDVSSALGRITDYLTKQIEKNVNLKNDRKETQRERELRKQILKSLRDEYAALRQNERAQAAANRELEKAKRHLQEVKAFVGQVREAFVQTASVIGLGIAEGSDNASASLQNLLGQIREAGAMDAGALALLPNLLEQIGQAANAAGGGVSGSLLLDQLESRRDDALRFAALIRQLTDDVGVKLNDTTLQELLNAGPQAGLATAEAIAAGGDAMLDQINQMTQEITQAGQSLGVEVSDEFFDGGLRGAEAFVRQLERERKRLDRVAERMAERLAEHLRKLLGGNLGGRNDRTADLSARLATGTVTTARTTDTISVAVRFTADEMNRLNRGMDVNATLDIARTSGARELALGRG